MNTRLPYYTVFFMSVLSRTADAQCSCINATVITPTPSPQDKNLDALLKIKYPLNDTNYYLDAFMQNTSDVDVLQMAKELDWFRVKELAAKVDFVEQEKNDAFVSGKARLEMAQSVVKTLFEKGIVLAEDQPAFRHQAGFQITTNASMDMAEVGLIAEEATRVLQEKLGLSTLAVTGMPIIGPIKPCREEFQLLEASSVTCNFSSPYRTMDGSCNNPVYVTRGAALTKHRRILFPDYANGISTPRRTYDNQNDLPSSRLVSTTINRLPNTESPERSIFHMIYGQFLDHDFTLTPITRFQASYGGGLTSCCDERFKEIANGFEDDIGCFSIPIPADDPFYSCHNQNCMEFKRSAPAFRCIPGVREQINQLSSYIDASLIYGVVPPLPSSDPLRTLQDGLLNVQAGNLLPGNPVEDPVCNTLQQIQNGQPCFMAGDGRLNEQTWLTFFHTVWTREHNRIATILKGFGYSGDERIYQETRRIVGAQIQHVTYNEYLPTILPNAIMNIVGLNPKSGTTQTLGYKTKVDASIANSFATATFRFGHSQVGDYHQRVNSYGTIETHEFSTTFFNPFFLYTSGSMGDLARGALQSRSGKADSYFTKEVSGKLFRKDQPFGLDLVALNIQRGRDHGIPGYTKWLKLCGLSVTSFSDLTLVMSLDSVQALQSVYSDVRDIDLFAGAMSETPISTGFLGFTFTCLLTDQFRRLKFGDRFWYEEKNQAGSFKPAQVQQLHQVTLARIMCNNIPELKYIQRYPLRNTGPDNPVIPCNCTTIPNYSLKPWV